jgi:hypothetical protein
VLQNTILPDASNERMGRMDEMLATFATKIDELTVRMDLEHARTQEHFRATDEKIARLGAATDERIEKLVRAIGEFVRRQGPTAQ